MESIAGICHSRGEKASTRGYATPDGRCLPCLGVTGRAVSISPGSSRSHYKRISHVKIISLKYATRSMSMVCNANSSNYRRNPDFSRQNKQGFSRGRNRQFEERDGTENLEESELFSSKNGTLLSVSGTPKFQATAAPGPREKEIVELFRKVQAQLRERAAIKEEKKNEDPRPQSKKSETVDSLLKLLRKHSVQQGKRSSSPGSSSDFILDQPERNGLIPAEKSPNFLSTNHTVKDKVKASEANSVSRPMSSFRRRSPVPQIKKQSIYLNGETQGPISTTSIKEKRKDTYPEHEDGHEPQLKLEAEHEPELELEPESELESSFPNGGMFDEMSADEITETDEAESDDERNMSEHRDLSGMKLVELRAVAKSHGVKGYSKLKKHELLELLCERSI